MVADPAVLLGGEAAGIIRQRRFLVQIHTATVSYTHLDVYKRQIKYKKRGAFQRPTQPNLCYFFLRLRMCRKTRPVSYTHLDVYKRQAQKDDLLNPENARNKVRFLLAQGIP